MWNACFTSCESALERVLFAPCEAQRDVNTIPRACKSRQDKCKILEPQGLGDSVTNVFSERSR